MNRCTKELPKGRCKKRYNANLPFCHVHRADSGCVYLYTLEGDEEGWVNIGYTREHAPIRRVAAQEGTLHCYAIIPKGPQKEEARVHTALKERRFVRESSRAKGFTRHWPFGQKEARVRGRKLSIEWFKFESLSEALKKFRSLLSDFECIDYGG